MIFTYLHSMYYVISTKEHTFTKMLEKNRVESIRQVVSHHKTYLYFELF